MCLDRANDGSRLKVFLLLSICTFWYSWIIYAPLALNFTLCWRAWRCTVIKLDNSWICQHIVHSATTSLDYKTQVFEETMWSHETMALKMILPWNKLRRVVIAAATIMLAVILVFHVVFLRPRKHLTTELDLAMIERNLLKLGGFHTKTYTGET